MTNDTQSTNTQSTPEHRNLIEFSDREILALIAVLGFFASFSKDDHSGVALSLTGIIRMGEHYNTMKEKVAVAAKASLDRMATL